MNHVQRDLWEAIRVNPCKWRLSPWGDEGDGFWVVGILGNKVIWFNDIEEGWNISTFTIAGTIHEYSCNQDELELQIHHLLDEIEGSKTSDRFARQPETNK
mgnify:FL=1